MDSPQDSNVGLEFEKGIFKKSYDDLNIFRIKAYSQQFKNMKKEMYTDRNIGRLEQIKKYTIFWDMKTQDYENISSP